MPSTAYASYAAALAVPDGGIASRPLLDVAGGLKVVLFALDAGQEISPHRSPFPAEVFVVRGRVEVAVGEARRVPILGERVELPMDRPHALRAIEASHLLLVMLRDAAGGCGCG